MAQGVPFAREYGGLLDNRSFGGAQVSRTFYARGQTGQQLLLGAYQALARQIGAGTVRSHTRSEMLDLVVGGDGRAIGIVTRDLVTGKIESWAADAVVLATGGYGNVFYLSTNAKGCNVTAIWRAHRKGALFANPCYTQIHPTCIPQSGDYQSKLTLMSESLRNDGRIWVPKAAGDRRAARRVPESERDYYLERKYPSFGNLAPRDIASRAAKEVCDEGRGVGPGGRGVYLDFADAIARLGRETIEERYGNLFEMYDEITGEDPYQVPMRIYPAPHYTMGGLWVDYNLMTSIPGSVRDRRGQLLGPRRQPSGRIGVDAGPGRRLLRAAVHDRRLSRPAPRQESQGRRTRVPAGGRRSRGADPGAARRRRCRQGRSVDSFHRELGRIMWDDCGMARSRESLTRARGAIRDLREQFWKDVRVLGGNEEANQALENAGRVADLFELGELMCRDALEREESCGGHFRVEHQTADGEAQRDDDRFAYVAAWQWQGLDAPPVLHKEPLVFENVKLSTRSYK